MACDNATLFVPALPSWSSEERLALDDPRHYNAMGALNDTANSKREFREFPQLEEGLATPLNCNDASKDAHWTARNPPISSVMSASIWILANTLATVVIVFTNKAIFSDSSLRQCQLSFAFFHFVITWVALQVLSRPPFSIFRPRRSSILNILPLSVAMCLNVILPNLSLTFSSVTFYQVARLLLTPTVALMNFAFHGAVLPPAAIITLVSACLGVGVVSYYDSLPLTHVATSQTTSPLGIIFAIAGVLATSLYTMWIASHRCRLEMSSMQLLHSQAPIAAFLLLYVVPFMDDPPVWEAVAASRWMLVVVSGICATMINVSQFFIVEQTGPVSSTVVGHFKTCIIVALGWTVSGRPASDRSIVGIVIAISSIMVYSAIMLHRRKKE